MAKTTNHVATFNGFTFTRGSKTRVYAFVVIEGHSIAAERIRCEKWSREDFKRNLPYFTELANGIHKLAAKYPDQYSPERIAKEKAEGVAYLARGEDGAVADSLARFDDQRGTFQTLPDGDTYYTVMGWTSRRDLAEKQASGKAHAIILPVTVV